MAPEPPMPLHGLKIISRTLNFNTSFFKLHIIESWYIKPKGGGENNVREDNLFSFSSLFQSDENLHVALDGAVGMGLAIMATLKW